LGAVSERLADGTTDESEDDGATFAVGDLESSTQWLTECKDAEATKS